MNILDKFYIDGAWVTPNGTATMPIMNPASNSQIGTLTLGDETDVNRAVAAAKAAFETFSRTTKVERLSTNATINDHGPLIITRDLHVTGELCFTNIELQRGQFSTALNDRNLRCKF